MPALPLGSGGGGGSSSYKTIKGGDMTSTGEVVFDFAEIDTIANDNADDLIITFYDTDGVSASTFKLKEGESLNDVHFTGTKIGFSGTTVNARYILLG